MDIHGSECKFMHTLRENMGILEKFWTWGKEAIYPMGHLNGGKGLRNSDLRDMCGCGQ